MQDGFYDERMARQQEEIASTADMRRQRAILVESLAPRKGESILELGCGNGILTRELKEHVGSGGRVVGADNSEAILSMAERLCPDVEFQLADAAELPFADGSFNAAVAAQLLCFLPDVSAALGELSRVLKPGGRLVLLDTDWDSLVWHSRRPDLMQKVVDAYTSVYADAHVPRTLSRRLEQSRFNITDRFSFTVLNWSNDADTYAGQTVQSAVAIFQNSDAFSNEDLEEWLSDQERLVATGEYLFSLNRYVFIAEKN